MESILLKLMEEKPSTSRKFWNGIKPHIVPFILGAILGGLTVGGCGLLPGNQWQHDRQEQ